MDKYAEQQQFLMDVLCTAFEGGSTYWAEAKNVKRDDELNYLAFDVRPREPGDREGHESYRPSTNIALTKWQHITPEKIDKAIRGLLNGRHKAASYVVRQFAGYPGNLDATDHDADGADVVVQLAAFGEIVFG